MVPLYSCCLYVTVDPAVVDFIAAVGLSRVPGVVAVSAVAGVPAVSNIPSGVSKGPGFPAVVSVP